MNAGVAMLLALLAASEVKDLYADLRRFPPLAVSEFNYRVAEESVQRQERELCVHHDEAPFCYVHYLTPLALNSPERAYRIETLQMTRYCRDCWRALARVSNEKQTDRHEWLEELQRLLGDDWWSGQMPPVVPLGRF